VGADGSQQLHGSPLATTSGHSSAAASPFSKAAAAAAAAVGGGVSGSAAATLQHGGKAGSMPTPPLPSAAAAVPSPAAASRRRRLLQRTKSGPAVMQLSGDSTTAQLIRMAGYPCEVHRVVTRDGYVLQMERIPMKSATEVVFMMHGEAGGGLGGVWGGVLGEGGGTWRGWVGRCGRGGDAWEEGSDLQGVGGWVGGWVGRWVMHGEGGGACLSGYGGGVGLAYQLLTYQCFLWSLSSGGFMQHSAKPPLPSCCPAAVLTHLGFPPGVLDTSLTWVAGGVTGSQAFAAWDNGLDVWLGTTRSNPPHEAAGGWVCRRGWRKGWRLLYGMSSRQQQVVVCQGCG
jgi:hypothetical protein